MDLIQAMTSGHGGSMTTLHANTPADSLHRLETMAMMSGIEMPLLALRSQIASAIEIVVQVGRLGDGSRKVLAIAEILGLDDAGRYRVNEIFALKGTANVSEAPAALGLLPTGNRATFGDELRLKGVASLVQLTKAVFDP